MKLSHSNRDDSDYLRHADDVRLAELGYRSEFKREFSTIELIAFSFSIMGVVASVTSTFSFLLVSGGHVGIIFGWLIPCLFVMIIAASMAEMASSMPTSAGLYYFAAKLAPPKYAARQLDHWMGECHRPGGQPINKFVDINEQIPRVLDHSCGFDRLFLMIATAIAVHSDGAIVMSAGATYGILLAILFSHGLVCSAATRILARLNLLYMLVNVGTTIATIVSLLVCSGDNKVSTKDAFTLFENYSGWTNNGWAFMLAFTSPMWTLTGYDSAAHVSEEVAGAARAAPLAILIGVAGTAGFGLILLIAVSYVIPSISSILSTTLPLPIGQVYLNVLGKRGMLTIWSFITVVQYVTGAAQGVDASRVVFAFARDNALPGSRWWKRMNHRTQTPVNAVWLVIFGSAICGLLSFSSASLSSLAGASVIGLYISYAVPIYLRITSGKDRLVPGVFSLGRWSMPLGIISVAWVAFIVVLLLFPPSQIVTAQSMNYGVVPIMLVFIFSATSWIVSAHKWFIGPVKTIDGPTESKYDERQN